MSNPLEGMKFCKHNRLSDACHQCRIAELEAWKEQTKHCGEINVSLEKQIAELEEKGMQQAIDKLCEMAADELNGLIDPDFTTDSINARHHMSEFANRLRKYRKTIKENK